MKNMRLNKRKFTVRIALLTIIIAFALLANAGLSDAENKYKPDNKIYGFKSNKIENNTVNNSIVDNNTAPVNSMFIKQDDKTGAATQLTDKTPDKTADQATNKVSNNSDDRATNKVANKANDKAAGKTAEKVTGNASNKTTNNIADKPTDKAAVKSASNTNKKTKYRIINSSADKSLKQVAITFDDGPDKKYTGQILDILKDNDIKATFFCIGVNINDNKDMLKRIADEGHAIGNHSWSHKDFTKLSKDGMLKEASKTEKLIKELTGEYTSIFRPPYGSYNKTMLETLGDKGYKCVNWSVDTKDWSGISTDKIMKKVRQQLSPGGIILLHSNERKISPENTVKVLPEIIKYVRSKGYGFITVPEMLEIKQ